MSSSAFPVIVAEYEVLYVEIIVYLAMSFIKQLLCYGKSDANCFKNYLAADTHEMNLPG